MSKDVAHFVAAGRSLEGVLKFREAYRKAGEAHSAFAQEFGTTKWMVEKYDEGDRLTGLEFDPGIVPDPKTWRRYVKARNPRIFCPNKMAPEGKALAQRIETLPPIPTDWQLIDYVMPVTDRKNSRVWDLGSRVVYPRCGLEAVSDLWVIKVHHNAGDPPIVAPLDARPIKASEVMAMQEMERGE